MLGDVCGMKYPAYTQLIEQRIYISKQTWKQPNIYWLPHNADCHALVDPASYIAAETKWPQLHSRHVQKMY